MILNTSFHEDVAWQPH